MTQSSFFMDGQMGLCLKSDVPGYNWPFLTILDFAIIFHLKNCLLGVIILVSAQPHVWLYKCFFILTYCINTMDLKSQKKT